MLLATSLVHLLPEVFLLYFHVINDKQVFPQIRETLEVLEVEIESLAEILTCCGFFMIYLVEDIAFIFLGEDHNESQDDITMNGYICHFCLLSIS